MGTGVSRDLWPISYRFGAKGWFAMDEETIEQQEVSDVDADTRDVTETVGNDYAEINARMDTFEKMQSQMFDMLKSIKSAQSDMVMTGNAVISESDDSEMADGFVPLEELDFSIDR